MADAATDAAIAELWPEQWAKATRSKRRTQLRRRYRYYLVLQALRAKGASCGNCRSLRDGKSVCMEGKLYCERDSDFHGYAIVERDGLCVDWSAKT